MKHRKVTKDGKVYHTKSFWWGDSLSALDATHKLMADAPLLLAEVKRLREEVKMLWQYVDTEQMYNDRLLTVEGELIE